MCTCISIMTQPTQSQSKTLVLVHALFRHGDRTPDKVAIYPNDPYKNEAYYPFGFGALTNQGKRRMYSLGKFLRNRYNNFLGNVYTPDLIYARSSDYDRTKMSLLLVLAALFPPRDEEVWNPDLKWQPIPYECEPKKSDKILSFMAYSKFRALVREELKNRNVQHIEEKYRKILDYISKYSGWDSIGLLQVMFLYFTLKSEEECGLQLPPWTQEIYPSILKEMSSIFFSTMAENTKLRQVAAGYLLQKIIKDTQAKIKGTTDTKLFLYSGHDFNISFVLSTLNIFEQHLPPYGCCVLIEVHCIDDQYGIKIYYESSEPVQTGLLKIPGYEEFCPLDEFVSLVEKYFSDDEVFDQA